MTAVDEDRMRLTGRHLPPWMIAPVADGGVQLEWIAGTRKIEVQIDPDGQLSYLIIDRSDASASYTEEHDVAPERVRSLVYRIATE
jgi:hypothetical protein